MTSTNSPHSASTSKATKPAVHSAIAQALMQKIEAKTAIIAIVGLGYVGLPLVQAIRDSGFPVIGFDVDQKKIDALNSGKRLPYWASSPLENPNHSGLSPPSSPPHIHMFAPTQATGEL